MEEKLTVNPGQMHPSKRRYPIRLLAVLNGAGLLLTACSVTEGRVTMVGGPPRVAVVNSPVLPSSVVEGVIEHVAAGDCFVLAESEIETAVVLGWPMVFAGGCSANEKTGVCLDNGMTIMSESEVIAIGEIDLPGTDQAAELPELSELCGAEDGGWLLLADIDAEG